MHSVWFSQQQWFSLKTLSISSFIMQHYFSEVHTWLLNIMYMNFRLHRLNVPDSESLCVQAGNELCNNFNTIFKWELREKIMGLPGLEYVRTIVATLHLPVSPEKYYELSRQKVEKPFLSAKLIAGIRCNQFYYMFKFYFQQLQKKFIWRYILLYSVNMTRAIHLK
jgi:hypothetical protein